MVGGATGSDRAVAWRRYGTDGSGVGMPGPMARRKGGGAVFCGRSSRLDIGRCGSLGGDTLVIAEVQWDLMRAEEVSPNVQCPV